MRSKAPASIRVPTPPHDLVTEILSEGKQGLLEGGKIADFSGRCNRHAARHLNSSAIKSQPYYPALFTLTTVIFSNPSSNTGGLSFSAILRITSSLTLRSRLLLRSRQTSNGTSKNTAWTS